jgi:hypothetical protein
MKVVKSPLIGKVYELDLLRHVLEEEGFVMGETFTYTYAAFDYELHKSKIEYDYYLRIFVDAVKGYIEKSGCEVQVNDIEIFKAMYHNGIFRDDDVPAQYVKQAEEVLKRVHDKLKIAGEVVISDTI